VGIAILGSILVFAGRLAILRAAGWMLTAEDPLRPAEAIVIAVDAGDAGVLEAADLVRDGFSRNVVLFGDLPEEAEREFGRRGIPYDNQVTRQTQELRALGVEHIEQIPRTVDGTEDEGRILPAWSEEHKLRSVIVVSSTDHTRRLRRVMRRGMRGRQTVVIVRPSRYSDFDPDRWWLKRGGIRTQIVELEKLLFDVVRHPFS